MTPLAATDDAIIAAIILAEGVTYTNDPYDAGGPTRWGITLAELSAWRMRPCTANDVKNLQRSEAETIYRARYLRPFDGLPDPLRHNAIDFGVNAGVRRSTLELQKLLGVTVDGWIGQQTRAAATTRTDWNLLYVGTRLSFYEDLIAAKPTQIKYRNGWRNRALAFAQPPSKRSARVATRSFEHMGKAA